MSVDFTVLPNIGPKLNQHLNALNLSIEDFHRLGFDTLFLKLIPLIGAKKALKGCYPRACCEAIIGAQKNIPTKNISHSNKGEITDFLQNLKSANA